MKFFAFIFTMFFAVTSANAGYGILLDCHGDDGIPWWADGDPMEIYVRINGVWDRVHTLPFPDCSEDDSYYIPVAAFSWQEVGKIKIRAADGSINMAWFDKVMLTDANELIRVQWGVDDNTGYCISDEDEGSNIYCKNGQAYKAWIFSR